LVESRRLRETITQNDLEPFFNPRSIAIVGASSVPGKLGTLVLKNTIEQGFEGKIFPINPSLTEAFGITCYPSISSLPVVPDLSVVLIPAEKVVSSVREHARKGIRNIIIMSAGFKEVGQAGKSREDELSSLVKEHGLRIIGPNCLGIYDNISKLDTFFVPRDLIHRPMKGGISLASQSGSFVGHVMDLCEFEHVGIARVITYGNKVDVDEVDALNYFASDPSTKVVGLYIEDVKTGVEFLTASEYCSGEKSVIVLKTGKHEEIERAVTSHTGAIAGSYNAYTSAFRKANLIEVDSETSFVDACKAVSLLPVPRGNRVLILGHAGGIGLTMADLCLSCGLEVPELKQDFIYLLRDKTLYFASLTNPIDLTASGTDEQAESVLEEIFVKRADLYDICIYLALWGLPQSSDEIGSILKNAMCESGKPIIVATLEGKKCLEKREVFESVGIPVFLSLERTAKVAKILSSLVKERHKTWKNEMAKQDSTKLDHQVEGS
jgi:acetyl-CoA synthetase (ADP-forming)